jgi:hypothetical protein
MEFENTDPSEAEDEFDKLFPDLKPEQIPAADELLDNSIKDVLYGDDTNRRKMNQNRRVRKSVPFPKPILDTIFDNADSDAKSYAFLSGRLNVAKNAAGLLRERKN